MRKTLLALAALLSVSGTAMAHEYQAGNLHIDHPWSLLLPASSANGAAYFVVHNNGKEADRLLGADTERAASAEIHEHVHKDGMMKMQKVEGVDIPAGGTLTFAPGGYHLMLFGLKKPLAAEERFPVILHFQKAGDVKVEILVQKEAPASGQTHDMHGMKMDMDHQ
ncbi:copper chaperone PCu(A)C [Pseudomonas schmalbachii]|uniref:Copper chaperone PCu(A)C n=1 Tax=Pseudomonas schmalbachii TaxID=2816993 RepID=A0ABS3TMM5_9PSED|nr:copper chaperone PCu(A)C [Pseudomonas schmalbachii]MBO3274909.1 copper chaperone PCu(A)C [Pseudomonas schmalbachii]